MWHLQGLWRFSIFTQHASVVRHRWDIIYAGGWVIDTQLIKQLCRNGKQNFALLERDRDSTHFLSLTLNVTMICAKDGFIIHNLGNDKWNIETFMLLTITLTSGEIRKQMIFVNQNFTELFQKFRGDGLLIDFMKKKLYIH